MPHILGEIHIRFGAINYRIKLILFVFLSATALFSAFFQLAYGYMWVRSALSGAPDCEDYDILDLAFLRGRNMAFNDIPRTEYIGEFKTRGYYFTPNERLVSFAFPQAEINFQMRTDPAPNRPANGSFIEVRGYLSFITGASGKTGVECVTESWQYCSVGYEIMVDLLTFGELSGTFVLMFWSARTIGSLIAYRAYMERNLGKNPIQAR